MRVLVTGGAGYLGAVLVRRLLEVGHRVRVLDSLLFGGAGLLGVFGHPRFEFARADVREAEAVAGALTDVEAVIHLAALVGDAQCDLQPGLARDVNLEATHTLVESAKRASVERFLLASTCSSYGRCDPDHLVDEDVALVPVSLYGDTKVEAEQYAIGHSQEGLVVSVLRLGTLFGLSPRMRFDLLLNEFVRDALLERRLTIYGPDAWRPFLHVRDAAEAFVQCLAAPSEQVAGGVFNVGVANCQKRQLATLLRERLPDLDVEFTGGRDDPRDYRVSFEKIEETLGFSPSRSVEEGIAEMQRALEAGIIENPTHLRYRNAGSHV